MEDRRLTQELKASYLVHYGTPRHSGRYEWGSGERPFQGDDIKTILANARGSIEAKRAVAKRKATLQKARDAKAEKARQKAAEEERLRLEKERAEEEARAAAEKKDQLKKTGTAQDIIDNRDLFSTQELNEIRSRLEELDRFQRMADTKKADDLQKQLGELSDKITDATMRGEDPAKYVNESIKLIEQSRQGNQNKQNNQNNQNSQGNQQNNQNKQGNQQSNQNNQNKQGGQNSQSNQSSSGEKPTFTEKLNKASTTVKSVADSASSLKDSASKFIDTYNFVAGLINNNVSSKSNIKEIKIINNPAAKAATNFVQTLVNASNGGANIKDIMAGWDDKQLKQAAGVAENINKVAGVVNNMKKQK